jgi:hypothetical protein
MIIWSIYCNKNIITILFTALGTKYSFTSGDCRFALLFSPVLAVCLLSLGGLEFSFVSALLWFVGASVIAGEEAEGCLTELLR